MDYLSFIWEYIANLEWVMYQVSSHFERDLHDAIHPSPSTWLSFNSLCPSSLSSLRLFTSLLFSAFLSLVSPSSNFTSVFFLLLQNFLHKDHSLGCVIPPSYTSSFPTILLSDEGRSSLPIPSPSFLMSFLLCFPLTFSLSFSQSVSLFPFVSICGVKWGGGSQLSCACWLACAMCQAGRIMTHTDIYIRHPTPHRPTRFALKKRHQVRGRQK